MILYEHNPIQGESLQAEKEYAFSIKHRGKCHSSYNLFLFLLLIYFN